MVAHLAVQGGHFHVRAQSRLGEGDGHLAPDIIAPALENGMGPHGNIHMQVAGRAAVDAGVALASHIQNLLIVNARGHGDLQALVAADPPLAVAGLAGGLHDLARAAAAVAGLGGLDHTEGGALVDPHLACAMAVLTGFGRSPGRGAGAVTVVAGLNLGIGDGLFAAFGRLLKGDGNVGLHVAAPPGSVGVGAPRAASAKAAEEAVENVGEVEPGSLEGAASRGAAPEIGIYARVAELVVARPLVAVGKHLVGLVHLFELGLRFLVPRVQVRVILLRQLPVRLFDLVLRGPFGHAQHLVIIPFIRHDPSLPSGQTCRCSQYHTILCVNFRFTPKDAGTASAPASWSISPLSASPRC